MEPLTRRHFLSQLGRYVPALGLAFAPGCHLLRPQPVVLPRVLNENPPLEDIKRVVNANTARVQSMVCNDAKVSSPLLPISPQANIALVRPLKFRMQVATGLTGTEVDIGSNDEIFWFWFRREQPPYLYYCRHDQYAQSAAKQLMPVEPRFLVEAFGLVTFETYEQHQGPFPVGSGRLEIRTIRATQLGTITKVTRVHEESGAVLEQHIYDSNAKLLASAITSNHQIDQASGAIIPRQIELSWPDAQMNVKVYLNTLQVNTLTGSATGIFDKPKYEGWTDVNLANPNLSLQSNSPQTGSLQQSAPLQQTPQQGAYVPPGGNSQPAWNQATIPNRSPYQPPTYGNVAPAGYQQQTPYGQPMYNGQNTNFTAPPLPQNLPNPPATSSPIREQWRASQ